MFVRKYFFRSKPLCVWREGRGEGEGGVEKHDWAGEVVK